VAQTRWGISRPRTRALQSKILQLQREQCRRRCRTHSEAKRADGTHSPCCVELTHAQPEAENSVAAGESAVDEGVKQKQLEADLAALSVETPQPDDGDGEDAGASSGTTGADIKVDGHGAARPENYKTRLCLKWQMSGDCVFGDRCNFAHGKHELQARTVENAAGCAQGSDSQQGAAGGSGGGGGGGGGSGGSGYGFSPSAAAFADENTSLSMWRLPGPYSLYWTEFYSRVTLLCYRKSGGSRTRFSWIQRWYPGYNLGTHP